jgi:hypothetical protein
LAIPSIVLLSSFIASRLGLLLLLISYLIHPCAWENTLLWLFLWHLLFSTISLVSTIASVIIFVHVLLL